MQIINAPVFWQKSVLGACFLLLMQLLFAAHGLIQPLLYTPQLSCYPGETLNFMIQIPETAPSEVSVSMPVFPEGVRLISSKKNSMLLNSQIATGIELVLQFNTGGTVRIPDIVLDVAGQLLPVTIPEITVHQKPVTVRPSLFWGTQQDGPYIAGNPVDLQLYVSGADVLQNLSFSLPQNILFEHKNPSAAQNVDIPLRQNHILPDGTMAALAGQFVWIPLFTDANVPVAKALVTSGTQTDLTVLSEPFALEVLPVPAGGAGKRNNTAAGNQPRPKALDRAFLPPETAASGEAVPVETAVLVRLLHDARRAERLSLFPSLEKRLELEWQLGIQESSREPPQAFGMPLIFLSALCLIGLCIAFLMRRRQLAVVLLCLTVLSGTALAYTALSSRVPYALVIDGRLKTVPETSASTSGLLPAGKRVRIRAQNDGWVFIESDIDGRTGWLETTQILELEP